MNERFNPVPIPTTGPAAANYTAGLLGDILGPIANRVVYTLDAGLDKARSDALDRLLGNRYRVGTLLEDKRDYPLSLINTPIVGPITLEKGRYRDYDPDGKVVWVEMEQDYELPWSSICTFSRAKIEAITELRGQKGSVKELFGFTDWSIDIRGFVINQQSDFKDAELFPLRELGGLELFCGLPDAIKVKGEAFARLRIRKIYIQNWNISEVEGKPNVLAYTIKALSDKQIEINIRP